ncbi:carbonic anhydrase [Lipomyces tetrasporus]|uniref:Carbonic anhydrase n=1 Tax=Lipomyces tetrasporus TaxID=54092 RepID=A0AAD7VT27_9ASCO|nr:carbonic anhydrase [Lipomyces tetrasporus]KAJ8100586.1 carbonic anhydrase [Lipomyces tetrasporus]
MSGQIVKDVTAANHLYSASFAKGNLPLPPGRKLAVVTCMDARLDPAKALGLHEGDAHVIRNAGGRSKDAIRSIIISQQLLGTEEVLIIHHTDCGMLTFSDSQLHHILQERFDGNDVRDIDFLPFSDLEQSVRDDVEYVRTSKVVRPEIRVSGWIYEVETGKIRPVST